MVELQHAEQIRREQERAVPHKDTVELAHAEPIQRPVERVPHPRELVELHHVSPPPLPPQQQRQRTASGSSVKDLVKCFENAAGGGGGGVGATGRNADLEMAKMKMRRTRSLQGLQSFGQAQAGTSASATNLGRPSWR
ncbi:hypothetical protein EXIGLDRAFT_721047 [Exidia glandulosa HHB12029]|uniref:Uncharacterized protein n=1 Tax=Exidia glandulosa HHB12029 TaxID=1314781 RepID=A0A166A9J3_EXIGL|nr:hypothetical protein EXIGLDRAFT_721047 [Exidia glandulosa HHB12029]